MLTALVLASTATGAQEAPVQVPLVGCETSGQVPVETPGASTAYVPMNSKLAAKLAYYASGTGLRVLAPRGWSCFGTLGSEGDELLVTANPSDAANHFLAARPGFRGPIVYLTHRLGSTSGRFSVAEIIMRVFPDYKSFAATVTEMFPEMTFKPGAYLGDRLNYRVKRCLSTQPPLTPMGWEPTQDWRRATAHRRRGDSN